MSDQPAVRAAEPGDDDRIRELVESSMTTSYALSPEEIRTVLEAEFGEEAGAERREDDDTVALVAEVDDVLSGFVGGSVDDGEGTVHWLHVDPERRGRGIGTTLFEQATSTLRDRGADDVRLTSIEANMEGEAFVEQLDLVQVEERELDIGGQQIVEYVYEQSGDAEISEASASNSSSGDAESTLSKADVDFPDSVTVDGEEVYVGDEPISGTQGPFAQTYADADRTEEHGYYCGNCESTDVSIDSMDRLKCAECGNTRKPDGDYDGSYL